MSIGITDVLSMVSFLSAGLADQNECTRCFNEVMIQLNNSETPWTTNYAFAATGTSGDSSDPDELTIPTAAVRLLGIFYSGRQLSEDSIVTLAGRNVNWRDEVGAPWSYTRDGEDARTVRVFPKPPRVPISAETTTIYTDTPLFLYAEAPTTGIPEVLQLPLALLILAREFERESNHRDLNAAQVWRAMGENMLQRMY